LVTAPEAGAGAKGRAERNFFEGEWWDVVTYYCHNRGCRWYNSGWLVSSNERGEVYERSQGTRGQDKTFNPLSKSALERGRAQIEEVIQADAEEGKSS
jgi:hypothetical protein